MRHTCFVQVTANLVGHSFTSNFEITLERKACFLLFFDWLIDWLFDFGPVATYFYQS